MSGSNHLTESSRLCLSLMRVGTRMASGFDTRFALHGITQAQFRVLLGVWQIGGRDGSVTPSVLADALFIERPTVTALVAKLVERDLLVRVPDAADRRSHGLRLTAAGGELLQTTGAVATRLGADTLAPFSDADKAIFASLLTRLESHLRGGI